ncbi:MAG: thiamine phosphate synthase [Rhizobiales bacterium]|nr:thiamine phosphate synthase [Hyphomicrobiales bacterium]
MNAVDLSVYLVTDRGLSGVRGVRDVVLAAARGGATMVQLRDPEAKTRTLVVEARALAGLLRPHRIPLIVNDRVDVALAADADGVHVGQSDMDVRDARALIGPDRILGLSITEETDLDRSDLTLVDYLGVGPVFATPTKVDAAPPMGMAGLKRIAARTGLPIVAIGGLHAGNAADAIAAGAAGVSVVSAICAAPDPELATRELAEIVRAARAGRA